MAKLSLSDSTQVREKLTKTQYNEIQRLYARMAEKARKEAQKLQSSTASGAIQKEELNKLAKELEKEAQKIGQQVQQMTKESMKAASEAVIKDNAAFLSNLGIGMEGAYSRVPTDIVETLISGKLYKGNWSLSGAIWSDVKKTQKDINKVIAEGLALNKSSYDIAKDLEKYVNPSARKDWDWSKVYPGTKKKVDYNAQRLARTMVGHAYQQSVVAVAKKNPYIEGILWISGHTSTTCQLCNSRDGEIFPVDKLPMDHPNGKCTFAPQIPKSMTEIADDLADWIQGKPNEALDNWFKDVTKGYNMGVEQSKLSKQIGKTVILKDLPKTTVKEASESWFEYENANLMSEYIKTGVMPKKNMYQQMVSDKDRELLMAQALKLQEAASKETTKYRAVYRGMVLQEEDIKEFKRNTKYTFDTLTASATDKKVASIYTDVENAGGEGIPVLFEIENPRGIRGYNRDDLEVVLPKGAQYRVEQTFYDEDGVLHVRMYAGKGLG